MDPFYIHKWNENPEMVFQLSDLIETDAFAVWDNTQRKFIRTGNMPGKDSVSRDITEIRFLKTADFRNLYTNCSRQYKIRRNLLVDGKPYTFEFARTANEQLKQAIEMLQNVNKNPLEFQFKLGRTGTGFQTRYVLNVIQPGDTTTQTIAQPVTPVAPTPQPLKDPITGVPVQPERLQPVAQPQPVVETPQPAAEFPTIPEQAPPVNVPIKEEPTINASEQEFLKAVKSKNIQNIDKSYFNQICRANNITDNVAVDKLWAEYNKR